MNKELLILRHAKSDWDADYANDRSRPLNKRGKRDAQLIGHWMEKKNLLPDLILCSPAVRASDTLKHVIGYFRKTNITTKSPDSLYLADQRTLLDIIRKTPESIQRLLLVGHNPGLEELVQYLSVQALPSTDNGKLITTANLVILEIPDGYQDLQQHGANLLSLIRPKELRHDY